MYLFFCSCPWENCTRYKTLFSALVSNHYLPSFRPLFPFRLFHSCSPLLAFLSVPGWVLVCLFWITIPPPSFLSGHLIVPASSFLLSPEDHVVGAIFDWPYTPLILPFKTMPTQSSPAPCSLSVLALLACPLSCSLLGIVLPPLILSPISKH